MTRPEVAPHGTWRSPVSAEQVAEGGIRLTEPFVEGDPDI